MSGVLVMAYMVWENNNVYDGEECVWACLWEIAQVMHGPLEEIHRQQQALFELMDSILPDPPIPYWGWL